MRKKTKNVIRKNKALPDALAYKFQLHAHLLSQNSANMTNEKEKRDKSKKKNQNTN